MDFWLLVAGCWLAGGGDMLVGDWELAEIAETMGITGVTNRWRWIIDFRAGREVYRCHSAAVSYQLSRLGVSSTVVSLRP